MYTGSNGSEFAAKLLRYLQEVDYRVAWTNQQRNSIFRLRYDAYLREDTIKPNSSRMFRDEYDEFENCWIFGIYIKDELVSSIRFHVISPDCPKGPALDVFPDIVGPMVFDEGLTLIDPTRFVVEEQVASEYPEMPYMTLRVACMAYEFFDAEYVLATVRKEHMAFYRRVFNAEILSPPRPYPLLKKPIAMMRAHVRGVREKMARRYPIFESSLTERRMIFENREPAFLQENIPNVVSKIAS
ncbi:MAG: hypothetical protein AAF423_09730 [Pseudomonadota bacterium]